jgi:hypothetical protein
VGDRVVFVSGRGLEAGIPADAVWLETWNELEVNRLATGMFEIVDWLLPGLSGITKIAEPSANAVVDTFPAAALARQNRRPTRPFALHGLVAGLA